MQSARRLQYVNYLGTIAIYESSNVAVCQIR